jgi:hypothetical protein
MNAISSTPAPLARHEVYAALCTYLPPPSPDTPEARAIRDERAIAAAIALRPADSAEAELAAQIVGADFHAKDALAAASQPNLTVDALKNHRAQASLMARTCQGTLRSLLSLQAARKPAKATQPQPRRPEAAPAPTAEPPAPQTCPPPARIYDPLAHLSEPERYCMTHPGPAARIRAERGLPKRLDFPAPKRDIVQAIVHGTGPIFTALDDARRSKRA